RGNLGKSDRDQFEKRFLSTSWGRERLQASRVFLAAITNVDPKARPSPQPAALSRLRLRIANLTCAIPSFAFALGTLALLLMVALSCALIESGRLRRQLEQSAEEQALQRDRQTELEARAAAGRDQLSRLSTELSEALDQLASLEARTVEGSSPAH